MNKEILSAIINLFDEGMKIPISFKAILDHWQNNRITNSEIRELLAVPTINSDALFTYKILSEFIKNGFINDYTVNAVCDLVRNNMQLFSDVDFVHELIDLFSYLYNAYTNISQEQLRKAVFTLEYLFARGVSGLEETISMLIKGINYNQFDENSNDALRCKLAIVYDCNKYNYCEIGKRLDSIIKQCIKSDLLHCYGMLFYYYGVYSSLVESFDRSYRSKHYGWTDSEYYIKKARQRGFGLAKDFYGN